MKYNIDSSNRYLNQTPQTMTWWNWYYWNNITNQNQYWYYTQNKKLAIATVRGGPLAPEIYGIVYFIDVPGGTEVCITVNGLPLYKPATNEEAPIGPHGFHLHEHGTCEVGNPEDPFQAAGGHWAPYGQPHGNHAGDFPVLFSNNGAARMCFFTNKFKVQDVVGKAVIIHKNPDDYRSQPSGDAGKRLACGIIHWPNQ